MILRIACVGTLKEQFWRDAAAEYCKRLEKYCTLTVDSVKEGRLPDSPSAADEEAVKAHEGAALLKTVKPGSYAIALDMRGQELSSEGLAEKLQALPHEGKSHVDFIIGGSLGLHKTVLDRADFQLSFSKMTFPHQMMRVILLEQIYRGFKIMRNETYHK